jgi:hypothetical protein
MSASVVRSWFPQLIELLRPTLYSENKHTFTRPLLYLQFVTNLKVNLNITYTRYLYQFYRDPVRVTPNH